jgi:hypothetical protein
MATTAKTTPTIGMTRSSQPENARPLATPRSAATTARGLTAT